MKTRAPSILTRILWLHLVALAAAAILIPLAGNLLLNASAATLQHRTLRTHARSVAAALDLTPDGRWTLDLSPDLKTLYEKGYGGFALAVIDDRSAVLFDGPDNQSELLQGVQRRDTPYYFEHKRGGDVFYGASFPQRRGDRTAWVTIAQDLDHPDIIVDDITAGFLGRMLLLTVPVLLVLFTIDLLIVRRALTPVVNTSRAAQNIQPGRMDQRLPTDDLPREIRPLADAMNDALKRLELGHARQKEFTADAAHELRTPLTILRMQVDAPPDSPLSQQLRPSIDLMTRIVGQLLEIAEVDAIAPAGDVRADLRSVATDVAVALTPLALSQDKRLALTGVEAPVWVAADAPFLFRAIRNLVENAIRHTPAGTEVDIHVRADGTVLVTDHGPGVAEADQPFIFRRFWRSERSGDSGAGLGLAIVQGIATTYNGVATYESTLTGARFRLSFRLTAPFDELMI